MSGGDKVMYAAMACLPAMFLTMPFAWFAQSTMGEPAGAVVGWVLFPILAVCTYVYTCRRWPPEGYDPK